MLFYTSIATYISIKSLEEIIRFENEKILKTLSLKTCQIGIVISTHGLLNETLEIISNEYCYGVYYMLELLLLNYSLHNSF